MKGASPDAEAPRLAPGVPFPPYAFIGDGFGHPHPRNHPQGHSRGLQEAVPPPLDPPSWRASPTYLRAFDLFNHGYYWEAHEEWEGLWVAAGKTGWISELLKGFIKLTAGGVKVRQGNADGARRHFERAAGHFEEASRMSGSVRQAGFRFADLAGFARRAESAAGGMPVPPPDRPAVVFDAPLLPGPGAAAFRMITYNILATSYIRPDYYPHSPPEALDPAARHPFLVRRLASLEAGVLCLQEAEEQVFAEARLELSRRGMEGLRAAKAGNKPDGCATFYDGAAFELEASRAIAFKDRPAPGGQDTGHIALLLRLRRAGRQLVIANTHLKWDAPGKPAGELLGLRQARALADARSDPWSEGAEWIICGDLNAGRDSEVARLLEGAGFRQAHADLPAAYSCNSSGQAKQIDYIFFSEGLDAEPVAPDEITDRTPLPSREQPSDHLPLAAWIGWRR